METPQSTTRMIESGGRAKESSVANKRKMIGCDLFLRAAAALLSLAAVVVMVVDRETDTAVLELVPTLPAVEVQVTAKWFYLSAFVYFVVANSIACGYLVLSLPVILINRGRSMAVATMIVVLDLIIVAVLFSSFGAALSIGIIGKTGNSHLRWYKVCFAVERFCNQGAVALGLSAAASLAFFLLVFIGILKLHK